jgi:hypothetical protein
VEKLPMKRRVCWLNKVWHASACTCRQRANTKLPEVEFEFGMLVTPAPLAGSIHCGTSSCAN